MPAARRQAKDAEGSYSASLLGFGARGLTGADQGSGSGLASGRNDARGNRC